MRQLEAAAKSASESQAEATAVQEAMSTEARRAQVSTRDACRTSGGGVDHPLALFSLAFVRRDFLLGRKQYLNP